MTTDPTPTPRQRMRMPGSPLAAMGQAAGYETAQQRADALAISRSHLLHMERGEFRPSPALVDRMAAAYKKPVAYIERATNLAVERLAERKIAHVRGYAD